MSMSLILIEHLATLKSGYEANPAIWPAIRKCYYQLLNHKTTGMWVEFKYWFVVIAATIYSTYFTTIYHHMLRGALIPIITTTLLIKFTGAFPIAT